MLRKFAQGDLKKIILPGSDVQSTIPKLEPDLSSDYSRWGIDIHVDRSYANDGLEEYDNRNLINEKESKLSPMASNMSCVESITHAGSLEELRDLDIDEIKLFEHYKFKDPSDISNNLEIAKYRNKIVQSINANCTILITGVTGCGKSTQVPQFILDDCMARKKYCNIIVTQPRRIAAISVSKQVNKERGWKNGLLVGYQVGRKRDFDSNKTKILFCTTGILLQKIIKAKHLSEFTHIILDEVHERSLEMDFLLLVIKQLLKNNSHSVHVILMSATANTYKLKEYFSEFYGPPHNIHVPAHEINVGQQFNHTIYKHYLDDLYGFIPSARRMNLSKPQIEEAGYETAISLIKAFDGMDINGIDKKSSVLVFLPGIFEIEEMHRLMEDIMVSENHKWTLIPLHSSITSEEQDRVFENPPLNHRKIILSTNIAESSITVPDVSYVIDFCLMKQLKNETRSNYSMLILTWASRSNCDQRAGRVGRVSVGRVYRLVSKNMFNDQLKAEEEPEMCRCSLSRIVLMSKLLDMGTPKQLIGSAIDVPSLESIVLTIRTLKQVGALLPTVHGIMCDEDGDLTYMGKVMAHLPLEPPMSKLIYFGYIFNILNEAIIMGCGLSIKSIFSQPFNRRLDAYTQKLIWANYSRSDPIAYIGPYQSWLEKKPEFDRNRNREANWARDNFIQLSAMRELYDLIDDVTNRLKRNFGIMVNSGKMKWVKPEEKAMACKLILAGAFYPNYFIRGTSNSYMDEHEVNKLLDDHNPNCTVYLSGFPTDQPKELYKEAIENLFPKNLVGKPLAYFSTSNKIFVEFPMTNTSKTLCNVDINEKKDSQLIPGNICFGVYVALKMHQLNWNLMLPLLRSSDATKKVEDMTKNFAIQKITQEEVLPIKKSVLQELEGNAKYVDVTISHFETVGCFWVQLFDNQNQEKLLNLWNVVNEKINLRNVNSDNLAVGNFYVVVFKYEKYRAKLTHFLHGPQEKYKFLLIDFGESVELFINDVFDCLDNDSENKFISVPSLAFQCTIAKICPAIQGKKESSWATEANEVFMKYGNYATKLYGIIYSIVNDIVSFEDLKFVSEKDKISIPEILINNKLACHSDESFASKIEHEKRSKILVDNNNKLWHKLPNESIYFKSPTVEESYTTHHLKGPFSPLSMTVHGINYNSMTKMIKIESQSVNSVLLDTDPEDYHEKLFVAGNVSMNENDRLTLWDTTMMPNIPGMPAIICLIFSPCVEIRYNDSYTKMIGAICGLGYTLDTSRPLFRENDIEITFDTIMDNNFLNSINVIRMLLNKCVNPEDEEGPGDIFQEQYSLQFALLQLLSFPTKFKAPESVSRKYIWGVIPKSRMLSPYIDDCPVDHPMGGSDVYKLIWGVDLSKKMSDAECKNLLYKLCKIKRLENNTDFNQYRNEMTSEELTCPLCKLAFKTITSINKHFKNYQHIARYTHARNELHFSYTGPFADLKDL